jgi:hypothetical protein
LRDPELTIRRIQVHLADDAAIAEAGLRLRAEEQWISACAIKLNRQSEAQSLEQEWDGPDFIGFEEWESQS